MKGARVKICGITSTADARACIRAGADYLGVILAESPRRITVRQAAKIRTAAEGGFLVGVFADLGLGEVVEAASRAGLDLVQLHGGETPEYVRDLKKATGLPVIKVLRYGGRKEDGDAAAFAGADYLLYDLDKRRPGPLSLPGPPVRLPALWEEAARVGADRPLFLAGGLHAGNVGEAVRVARPHAVDVCSGVERSPGAKDPDAVRAFVREAKSG